MIKSDQETKLLILGCVWSASFIRSFSPKLCKHPQHFISHIRYTLFFNVHFFCENIFWYLLDISFILPASIWSSAVLFFRSSPRLFMSVCFKRFASFLVLVTFTMVKSEFWTFVNRFIKDEEKKVFCFISIECSTDRMIPENLSMP